MAFRPNANDSLLIDGVSYHIAEHPAAPGMPYGQEGRQAVVFQLVMDNGYKALKVFKPRFQVPALVSLTERLAPLADLLGLQVCHRAVLAARRHMTLLRQYPDLTYAVLMPWIEGPTWMEVLLNASGYNLSPEQCLVLARSLVEILAAMEERGVAHCDLSGSNLIIPSLAHSTTRALQSAIELVDVEQLFGLGLERPEILPSGSAGYAHKGHSQPMWGSTADRFAGAVLLAEMLSWCDPEVRNAAWGESYFDPNEMQMDSGRYQVIKATLQLRWGADVAGLFERAWESNTLSDCATFGQWMVLLPEWVPERSPVVTGYEGEQPQVHSPAAISPGATEPAIVPRPVKASDHMPMDELSLYPERSGVSAVSPAESIARPQPAVLSAQQEDLAGLFDDGLAAYQQGDWARSKELLGEVVRRQPDYKRGKQQAARLLADADRHLTSARPSGSSIWARIAIPTVLLAALLVFGWIAVTALQAQEATGQAQAHATSTAVALLSAHETATTQAQAAIDATATYTVAIGYEYAKATAAAEAQTTSTAEAIAAIGTSTAVVQSTSTAEAVVAAYVTSTAEAVAVEATNTAQAKALEANNTATAVALAASAQKATAEAQANAYATATAQAQAEGTAQALTESNQTATAQTQATTRAIAEARQTATAQAMDTITARSQATAQAQAQQATPQAQAAAATSVAATASAKETAYANSVPPADPGTVWEHLTFNLDNPKFQDKSVRQAIAYAIDRQSIAEQAYPGQATVAHTFLSPAVWSSMQNPEFAQNWQSRFPLKKYNYDPARANQLLDQSGWVKAADGIRVKGGNRLSVDYATTTTQIRQKVSQQVVADLLIVGIEARPRFISAGDFFDCENGVLVRREFEVAQFAWVSSNELVYNETPNTYHSQNIPVPGNSDNCGRENYGGYSNARFDQLASAVASELGRSDVAPLFAEMQSIWSEELPAIPLYFQP